MTDAAQLIADAPRDTQYLPFEFRGTASEYFRIWIVNLLLTVVTLGIYSAWAKVRKNRYLYGSTYVAERSFEYTAEPEAILKGRIIAVVAFLLWYGTLSFLPLASLVLTPLIMIAVPWVVVRALRFRAYHTRYRNRRFNFKGRIGEAAVTFIVWPLATFLTLGLLWPYFAYAKARFVYGNFGYGGTPFRFNGLPGVFYGIYFALFGVMIGALIVLSIALSVMSLGDVALNETANGPTPEVSVASVLALAPFFIMLLFFYVVPPAFLKARVGNYTLNETEIGHHFLQSTMRARDVFWIYLSNLLAIVASLGLAIPWATIRMARYRAQHTELVARGDLDDMPPGPQDRTAAAGEELGEFFDIDIGF